MRLQRRIRIARLARPQIRGFEKGEDLRSPYRYSSPAPDCIRRRPRERPRRSLGASCVVGTTDVVLVWPTQAEEDSGTDRTEPIRISRCFLAQILGPDAFSPGDIVSPQEVTVTLTDLACYLLGSSSQPTDLLSSNKSVASLRCDVKHTSCTKRAPASAIHSLDKRERTQPARLAGPSATTTIQL